MKKLINVALLSVLITTIFVFSCKKENSLVPVELANLEDTKYVDFKGLQAVMPKDFPEELVNYKMKDIENVINSEAGKSLRAGEKKTLDEVLEKVLAKYPSFDTFDAKGYQKYFPKMSIQEIIENSGTILQYMEKLMGYDVANTFAKEGDGILKLKRFEKKNSRASLRLENDCYVEYAAFYISRLRVHDAGLHYANSLAFHYQNKYYPSGSKGDDAPDALRHGVWATFVAKYGCYRYSTVSEASIVAYEFVDLHECNDYSASSNMDRHNNYVSLKYYGNNAERFRVNWLNYNTRVNKTDDQIAADINNTEIQLTAIDGSGISSVPDNILVRIN